MGKVKKSKRFGERVTKPEPLADQILHESEASSVVRVKQRNVWNKKNDDEYVDGTLGQNIIKQSLAQLQELNDEEFPPLGAEVKRESPKDRVALSLTRSEVKKEFKKSSKKKAAQEDDSDAESVDETVDAVPLNVENIVKSFEDELDLDEEDKNVLEYFKKKDSKSQKRLGDFFRDKITEKQTEIQSQIDAESIQGTELKPETLEECKNIGQLLSKYRSGRLPKSFKTFPSIRCWEQLLHETEPDKWTAAAVYQTTRMFVSNLKAPMAQRFCNLVLLPRIRDDISYYKRLNFHLYQALTKSLYKPAAFFKGIILPLCAGGDCTLREAIIIGSVMANNHIPVAHSAAAIRSILEMEYQGANYIFLRVLLDKKYALPYQTLDTAVEHYARFAGTRNELPVLWHQSLLCFVQRYKNDLTVDQKDDILELVTSQGHFKITPQIRRELAMSTNREETMNTD